MTYPAPQIPYLQTPATIVNLALDSLGQPDKIIGDITDGSDVAEAARRNYGLLLRGLLRTAHWVFARKNAQLQLLGDATLQDTTVSPYVECPWSYAYAWPIDGVAARWMPATYWGTASETPVGLPFPYAPNRPARFLVTSSDQYPTLVGNASWDQMPDYQRTEGVGPTGRTVILSNQPCAHFVYTSLVTTIEQWDDMFRAAMVSLLAVAIAPTAINDSKLRIAERDRHIAMAKEAVANARVANGQDAGYPQTTDRQASWITARGYGAQGDWGMDNLGGTLYAPWSEFSFSGSVF